MGSWPSRPAPRRDLTPRPPRPPRPKPPPSSRLPPSAASVAVCLIVAAGRGERLGSDQPKAFVVLAGASLLERSLATARAVCDEVVVALPPDTPALEGVRCVAGGATRSHSVRN